MSGEQILGVVWALMALAVCFYALRDARWWQRNEKHIREPEKKRERTGHGGPWGG